MSRARSTERKTLPEGMAAVAVAPADKHIFGEYGANELETPAPSFPLGEIPSFVNDDEPTRRFRVRS